MSSDTDFPYKQDTNQQQPPPRSFKPLIWKVIFILLSTGNLLLGFLVFRAFYGVYLDKSSGSGVGLIPVYFVLLALVSIDFIIVFFYIMKQRPQGRAKVISNWLQVLDTTELPQINQCVRH